MLSEAKNKEKVYFHLKASIKKSNIKNTYSLKDKIITNKKEFL